MQNQFAIYGNIPVDCYSIRKRREEILKGHGPGGSIIVAYYLKELTSRDQVFLVANIGDDEYERKFIEPQLERMNTDYVQRVKDAKTRLYKVDITNPMRPKITRLENAEKLMKTPYMDISPALPSISTIHFQSYSTIFENKHRDRTIEVIRKAHEMKIPTVLDWNKRKKTDIKKEEKIEKKVLDMLDTLKMNKEEAKSFVEPNSRRRPIIRLRNRELEELADEIMDNFTINRLVITLGDQGSYVQTRKMSLRFDAVKSRVTFDATGAGDAASVAYNIEKLASTDEIETGTFSNIMGCLAVEHEFSFPRLVTKRTIRQYIVSNHVYCQKYKVSAMELLEKLGI